MKQLNNEPTTETTTELLTPKEVSDLLKISIHTLRQWRCNKAVLNYHKISKAARYNRSEIIQYIQSREIKVNTNEV